MQIEPAIHRAIDMRYPADGAFRRVRTPRRSDRRLGPLSDGGGPGPARTGLPHLLPGGHRSCRPGAGRACDDFQWIGLAKLGGRDPLFQAARRQRRHDGRQDP